MKRSTKLSFKRETIRQLSTEELGAANGGGVAYAGAVAGTTKCYQETGNSDPVSTHVSIQHADQYNQYNR